MLLIMRLKVLLFGVDTCSLQYLIYYYVMPERGLRPFYPEPVHLTGSQTGFTIPSASALGELAFLVCCGVKSWGIVDFTHPTVVVKTLNQS